MIKEARYHGWSQAPERQRNPGADVKRKPWHEAAPDLYARVVLEVQAKYHNLHFSTEGGLVFMRGGFPVSDSERVIDRYYIEVEFPPDFPDSLPTVREVGGRIPRTADRHILEPDGTVCLYVPDEASWVCPDRSDILSFLDGPVRNSFIGQTVFELTGKWPFGQRSHDARGFFEFYSEKLGVSDARVVLSFMNVMRQKEVKGHWRCPCSSGKRLRDCHYEIVREFRQRTGPAHIDKSYRRIIEWIRTQGG